MAIIAIREVVALKQILNTKSIKMTVVTAATIIKEMTSGQQERITTTIAILIHEIMLNVADKIMTLTTMLMMKIVNVVLNSQRRTYRSFLMSLELRR